MALSRRWWTGIFMVAAAGTLGWVWQQSLVPAIHPDHDHGLENIAGGGYLRVEDAETGKKRNLVGRPDRVLILHWFKIGLPATASELPLLVDYARSVAGDPKIEVVLIACDTPRPQVLAWAKNHAVPTTNLYADPKGQTASLIGVRRYPETMIYDPEGHLVHQARGVMEWNTPQVRASIEGFKHGGEGHQH